MPGPGQAYCSTLPGALTFLLRITLCFIFAVCFFSGAYAEIPKDSEARYKLYFAYLWGVTMVVFSIVGHLVESLTLGELWYTRLGSSLYVARIKLAHLVGFVIATMVWFAMSSANQALLVARRKRLINDNLYYRDDNGILHWRTLNDPSWKPEKDNKNPYMDNTSTLLIANLIVNTFVILAMVRGGGIRALIIEAKAMRKTLSVAKMFGVGQERDGVAEKRS